ncbi:phosphate ABC transporter permease subunit PstC [Rhodobacteraceae bacterium RKSG542]|uniref:phosphate ABC transporter permease subunit PstC n=1 Tax=Pseudovibrio flavus TaxID=2529854 RepID=UPI0012BB65F7|nr:phosphate ABC transporter permease subunit PstC [Pseudovibrio flavus]MTI16299.1 phosphate ABC transporter permease subunit PstC [Pseudovibrio flavus]
MKLDPFCAEQGGSGEPCAPSFLEILCDRGFRWLTFAAGGIVISLGLYIIFEIGSAAVPAMKDNGLGFFVSTTWDVARNEFGILAEIWGTLYSSLLALLLGGFFGVSIAIFFTQGYLNHRVAQVFRSIIQLLAAIPSVVYGLWGIYVVIPALRPVASWLNEHFGFIPFFGTKLSGPGLAPAVIVLAIMILPTVAAISQDAFKQIPYKVKEAAYGMGTTRREAIMLVMLPTAANGIMGALVLGFGRALGETMALAMLIGNANQISLSLFSPAKTLASLLASNFPEAGAVEVSALMYAAVALLIITVGVNALGAFIMSRSKRQEAI